MMMMIGTTWYGEDRIAIRHGHPGQNRLCIRQCHWTALQFLLFPLCVPSSSSSLSSWFRNHNIHSHSHSTPSFRTQFLKVTATIYTSLIVPCAFWANQTWIIQNQFNRSELPVTACSSLTELSHMKREGIPKQFLVQGVSKQARKSSEDTHFTEYARFEKVWAG